MYKGSAICLEHKVRVHLVLPHEPIKPLVDCVERHHQQPVRGRVLILRGKAKNVTYPIETLEIVK